ncbi:putative bicarbonate transporter [Helianthus debilis subsp. tardiflorus]
MVSCLSHKCTLKALLFLKKQFIRKKLVESAKESIKLKARNIEIYNKMQTVFVEIDSSPITTSVVKELKDLQEAVMKVEDRKENTNVNAFSGISLSYALYKVNTNLGFMGIFCLHGNCTIRENLRQPSMKKSLAVQRVLPASVSRQEMDSTLGGSNEGDVSICDAEILDELTTSRGELKQIYHDDYIQLE